MGFVLDQSDDQGQILDAAAVMLSTSFPISRLRDDGRDTLAPIAAFGAFALAAPEEAGGAGFSVVEEALVHTLFGRHLISTRSLATAVAAAMTRERGMDDLALKLYDGSLEACAAITDRTGILVIDGDSSNLAVVFGDRRLTLINLGHAKRETASGLGRTISVQRVRRDSASLVEESAHPPLLSLVDILVSAQLLGIAEATRDLAVNYAKLRQQFGKPIGAFQAVKHHCANMAITAEMLSAQLDMAAIALRDGRDDAAFQLAALRRLSPRTALGNARTCIQLHGGIGFSAEADAHHFLKHAHVLARLGTGAPMLDAPAALAPYVTAHHEASRP